MDQWGKLWEIAMDSPEGYAVIKITDSAGEVELVWPDSSRAGLYWDNGKWNISETLDTTPCDVAARDSF